MHAHPLGITAREQSRTGRSSHWCGHHKALEFTAFLGDAIDVWSANSLGSETAQVAVALVIGEDDDEIGLGAMHGSGGKEHGQQAGLAMCYSFHCANSGARIMSVETELCQQKGRGFRAKLGTV